MLSYWTVALLGFALLALHAWWFAGCRAMPRTEIVSGFGAALTVLGVFVAARPYIRSGVAEIARGQVPRPEYPGFFGGIMDVSAAQAADAAKVEAAKRDVVAERGVAVLFIVAGTLLNGYGGPIARGLSISLGLAECA